jgi:hypothetical protein
MSGSTVVILAPLNDIHAVAVKRAIQECSAETSVLVVDGSDFPQNIRMTVSKDGWTLRGSDFEVHSSNVCSVWWRRPGSHRVDSRFKDEGVKSFASRECIHTFDAIATCGSYLVVNKIDRELLAVRKPYQLWLAQQLGFDIPEYHVTNDEIVFDSVLGSNQPHVFKTMNSPSNTFGETRELTKNLGHLRDVVPLAPTIFQRRVPRLREYRVTVIGNDCFVHEIKINNAVVRTLPDWRLDVSAQSVESEIPETLRSRVFEMMKRLELSYGAFDFIEDEGGMIYFLEINPHGQFLFNEADAGTPMARSMAKLLLGNAA